MTGVKNGGGNEHAPHERVVHRDARPQQALFFNFDIAAYLAEVILLGAGVALRCGEGKRMDWDGPNMVSTNLPESAQFVKRKKTAPAGEVKSALDPHN